MPSEVLLLYRIVLGLLGFLLFHMKLSTVLSRSVNNFAGILMGIVLNLYIAFGKITIFTMLILPTQEQGRSFHFMVSSSMSLFKNLQFLSNKSSLELSRDILCYMWLL